MRRTMAIGSIAVGLASSAAYAQTVFEPGLEVTPYIAGLSAPIAVRFIGADRAFVIQKNDGRVIFVDHGVRTTVLDLNVQHDSERGLLGIALDPRAIA